MILTVENAIVSDRKGKEPLYQIRLKGYDENYVEATLTLKCNSRIDIEKYAPLISGERRLMRVSLLDHTLDDYVDDDMRRDEKRAALLKRVDEEVAVDRATERFVERADALIEKRRKAAAEQAGGE